MQGIWLNTRRPKSKKEIKEVLATNPENVSVEATSWFGNEYEGPVLDAPNGTIYFVGPDPHTSRKFYGSLHIKDGKVTVK